MANVDEDLSDEVLTNEIKEILKTSGLQISSKTVLQKLEKKLKLDLSEQKKRIYRMLMEIVDSMESEEEDLSESEASEEEVVVKKEVKPKKENKPKKEVKPKKKAKKRKKGSDEEENNSNDSDWGGGGAGGGGGGGGGGPPKRKSGSGYTRAYKLSPALAELMGEEELPRHEVVKRIWAIVKEKQLFDPKNRQFAICDKALHKVIGIQRFRMFGMMKYLKNHFLD